MFLSKNKKSGIWFVYFNQPNGKRTRHSTHTTIKKDALKYLNDFDKPKQPKMSMNVFYEKYIESKRVNASPNHLKQCKYILNNFIRETGDVQLKSITRMQAENYILTLYERSKHLSLFNLRNLKAAFNTAISWDLIEKNPFKGIKLRVPENYPIYLTKKEIDLIIETEQNVKFKCLYGIMANTGCRTSEMLNLEWSDIDFENNVIKVLNKSNFSTKSKKQRNIPINKSTMNYFEELGKKENGYIIDNDGKPYSISYASKKFKRCVRKANLNDKYRLYYLRHSFASHLVQKSASIYAVKNLLGHSSTVVTQRYAHLSNESLKDAVDLLN